MIRCRENSSDKGRVESAGSAFSPDYLNWRLVLAGSCSAEYLPSYRWSGIVRGVKHNLHIFTCQVKLNLHLHPRVVAFDQSRPHNHRFHDDAISAELQPCFLATLEAFHGYAVRKGGKRKLKHVVSPNQPSPVKRDHRVCLVALNSTN